MFCFEALKVLPEEFYKSFHILDQKHHLELFRKVGVPEKQKAYSKNTCEWVHILVNFRALVLTLNSFTSIFEGFC